MSFTKKLALAALLAAPLYASAAVTNGQLTFTWQGTIPAQRLAADWRFTDALGADYIPAPQTLTTAVDSTDNTLTLTTTSPVTFNIQSDSVINGISAYLASAPIAVGFKGSRQLALRDALGAPANNQILITLNNAALKVGSANAIDVVGAGSDRPISLGLYAKVSGDGYGAGSSVSFTTPVVFAVDLG
ncbi:Cro/Cl family transcriptional regulator (plasmid) [Edwardsiella ictaluri]|uniref:Cro/Cl family transcriptional regulator n=1 Tax=Edwardsiella ictaluri TaxID=67780 RepID=UPI0036D2579E